MNKYQDVWGRFHDKPCLSGHPSCNNAWLYTAYQHKLNEVIGLEHNLLKACFRVCLQRHEKSGAFFFTRHPYGQFTKSPYSRDEVIGAVYLGLIGYKHLLNKYNEPWNFSPYELPKFSLIKLIKQLWELRPDYYCGNGKWIELTFQHRNYFWQNDLDQLYRFAFSVPLVDRAFILKQWDKFKWYKPSHAFYGIISYIDSLLPTESGIRWLKYGKSKEAMLKEFPEDHPFRSL